MSTQVKVGDRVRITYEGVVTGTPTDAGVFFDKLWNPTGDVEGSHSCTVELIERAKPKVGDVVEGEDAYRNLPVGTVAKGSADYRCPTLYKRADGIWYTIEDRPKEWAYRPRTIAFLPEG